MNNRHRTIWLPTIAVFLVLFCIVIFSYSAYKKSIKNEARNTVDSFATETRDTLTNWFNVFEETLYAGAGLFASDSGVSKHDWSQFVKATAISSRYSGTQGLGYVKVVDKEGKSKFEQKQRKLISPNYNVHPSGELQTYAPVVFVEAGGETNDRVIGFDMFSDETRRAAMIAARNNNDAYMTDAVKLVQDEDKDEQGFLIYVPQYKLGQPIETVEQRNAAIEGYIYAAFRGELFFAKALEHQNSESIAYKIYSASDDEMLLYETSNYNTVTSGNFNTFTQDIFINGAKFSIEYAYNQNKILDSDINAQPFRVLFFGTIASGLLAALTYLLLLGRSNELKFIQERKINEAKDSLLSIASHQLRTPATGVKQYIGMMIQGFAGDIPKEQLALLQKAYESNERQLKTINDVLYLARVDSGRIVMSEINVNLVDIINSLLDELADHVESKGHKIVWSPPKRPVYIYADEHMIRMCFDNLLTNAIKYTPENGKIEVGLRQYKETVKFSVKDSGVGISPEDQKMLFKQFSRIPNELSKLVSGTGVGLYLSKQLVERHGGKLQVKSVKNKGSTFTIILPKRRIDKNV